MSLADWQRVTTRKPRIYIGRRHHRGKDGSRVPCSIWWAVWCRDGKQFQKSLHTDSRTEARQAARTLGKQLRAGAEPPPPPPDPSLQELCDQYVEYQIGHGHADRTVAKYRLVLGTVVKWSENAGVRRALGFDQRRYWAFNKWMTEKGYSQKTRYDRLITVKQLFKWAARCGLFTQNPIASAELLRKPDPAPQPCFTPQQVGKLIQEADEHYRPVFATMAYAGLRFGEVRDLEWDCVRLTEEPVGWLLVRRGGSGGTTKTGRSRRIPLHPELHAILAAIPRLDDRLVFVERRLRLDPEKWFPLSERQTLMTLKRLCARCEFENAEHFKLHTLRHVFCSMCARSNIPFKYALTWLGHRKSEMLDHYFHAFDETAAAAMRSITYPKVVTTACDASRGDYSI